MRAIIPDMEQVNPVCKYGHGAMPPWNDGREGSTTIELRGTSWPHWHGEALLIRVYRCMRCTYVEFHQVIKPD